MSDGGGGGRVEIGLNEVLVMLVGVLVAAFALRNEATKAMLKKAQQADEDERALVCDMRDKLGKFYNRLHALEGERDTAIEQVRMLTERVRSLEQANDQKQLAIEALEKAYEAGQQQWASERAQMQAEIDGLRAEQQRLHDELGQKGTSIDELKTRLKAAEKQATKAEAEAGAYGIVLNTLMERLERIVDRTGGAAVDVMGTPRPA